MIFGGRFLSLESQVVAGPQTIKMMELVGFDPIKKKYVHVSVEDDSTTITQDEGTNDAAKKLLTMSGTDVAPDGKDRKFRYTITNPADGAFRFEYFLDDGQGEKQILSCAYKKK